MINKESVLINALLEMAEYVYYNKYEINKIKHECFRVELLNINTAIYFESSYYNTIKIRINEYSSSKSKLESPEKSVSLLVHDWTQLIPIMDKVIKIYQDQKNEILSGYKGINFYNQYFDLFKKILREEKIDDYYSVNHIGVGTSSELITIKEGDKVHHIKIGESIHPNCDIHTSLGLLEIAVEIDDAIPNKINNKTTRVMLMSIPGYEIKKYPTIKTRIKIKDNNGSIDNFMQEIQSVISEKNPIQSVISYIMLEEKMATKSSINNIKRKI